MMKRITILFLTIALILCLIIPSFALTKKERAWKEDILTLFPLVKRVGDYSDVVDLIELVPALKEDPEIRKAFVIFAPPGATPPVWARGEKEILSAIREVPETIVKEGREREKGFKEELEIRPTLLPRGAQVIHSTDVVSGVKAEMVEGKARITITLSGERQYTVSERTRPPSIIIDIPHTINAVSPGRIIVNRGGVSAIEVTQHRLAPMEEARVTIQLSRFKAYEVKSETNEIYVEFEDKR